MTTQPVAVRGWVPTDDTFGARLAMVRQRMGWGNVKEAALACGLPVGSWRNWERDGRLPRDVAKVAAQIATATGADLDWLIRGNGGGYKEAAPAAPEMGSAEAARSVLVHRQGLEPRTRCLGESDPDEDDDTWHLDIAARNHPDTIGRTAPLTDHAECQSSITTTPFAA